MQRLSHTTGYAILALGFVGSRPDQWVQAQDIAAHTGLPKPYLSKILHALGKSGLLKTKRGYRGGVRLTRPADAVSLHDVAAAVTRPDERPQCILGMKECSEEKSCPMHAFWKQMRSQFAQQLTQLTLAQVANYQASVGVKFSTAQAVEQFFHEVQRSPLRRFQTTKPTGRFRRKFQAGPG